MKLKFLSRTSVFIFIIFFYLKGFADICPTHLVCSTNTDCSCTVMANSAYQRNFYIDFPSIQKGYHYECHLQTDVLEVIFTPAQSIFPQGSQMLKCSGDCNFSPVTFILDTTAMSKIQDTLTLKYGVPPSDIPTNITANCH